MTRLVLLRHGQTEWNSIQRMQGHADIHLDEVGIQQAHGAAKALSGRDFQAVYSSDLARASVTAQIVAEDLGVPVELDERLREIHMGSWEGRSLTEITEEFPQFATYYWEGRDFRRSETGETVADVMDRAMPAVEEMIERHRGHDILVVSHGFMISQLVQRMVGLNAHDRILGGLDNAHWSEVGIPDEGKPWVIAHNTAG